MSRHTKDIHSVKTRQLAVLNPDGSFPEKGDVMTVTDWRGSIQPSSDITLNSITATNISVTGPILQSTVVANTLLSTTITTDDVEVGGLTRASDISANNIVASALSTSSAQCDCLTIGTLNTPTLSVVSIKSDDISGGATQIVSSITASNLVVNNSASVASITTAATLAATNVQTQQLNAGTVSATYAKITDLSAQSVSSRVLRAVDLSAGSVTVTNANVTQNLSVNNLKTSGVFTFVNHYVQDLSSVLVTSTDISTNSLSVNGTASLSSVTANKLTAAQINVTAINTSDLSANDISASTFSSPILNTGSLTSTGVASMNTINSLATLTTVTASAAQSISTSTFSSTNTLRVDSDISLNGGSLTCVPEGAGLLVNGAAISSVWAMYPDQTPFNPLQTTITDISASMSGFITSFNRFLKIFSDRDIVVAVNPSYKFNTPVTIQFLLNGIPKVVRFPVGNNYLDLMINSLNDVNNGIIFSASLPSGPYTSSWQVLMDVSTNGNYAISDLSGSSLYYFSNLPMGSLQVMRYLGFTVDPFNNPFETIQMGPRGLYSSSVKQLTGKYYSDNSLDQQYTYPSISPPNIVFSTSDPYSISFQQPTRPSSSGTPYFSIFQAGRGYSLYPAVTGQVQKIYDLTPATTYTITPIYLDDYTSAAAAVQTLTTSRIPAPSVNYTTTYNTIAFTWPQPYPGKIYTFDLSASGQYITPSYLMTPDLSYTYTNLLRNSPYKIIVRSFDSAFNTYSQPSIFDISTNQLTVPPPRITYITNTALRMSWSPSVPIDVSATMLFDYASLALQTYVLPSGTSYLDISGLADITGLTDISDISCSLVYTDNRYNTVQGDSANILFSSIFGFDVSANAQYPLILDNIYTVGLGYTIPTGSPWSNNIVNRITFPGKGIIETSGYPATFVAKVYQVATSNLTGLYSKTPWIISGFTLPATPVAISEQVTLVGGSTSNPVVFFKQAKFSLLATSSWTTIVMFQLVSTTGRLEFPTFTLQSPIQGVRATALTLDTRNNLTNGFNTSLNGITCTFNYENTYKTPEFTLTAPTPYDISFSVVDPIPSEIESILVDICGQRSTYPNTLTAPITFTSLVPNTSYTITVSYVRPFVTTSASAMITTLPVPPPILGPARVTLNQIALNWDISYNTNYTRPRYLYQLDASGSNPAPPYISPSTTQISGLSYVYNALLHNVIYTTKIRTYDTSYNLYSTPAILDTRTTPVIAAIPVLSRGAYNTVVDISCGLTPEGITDASVNYYSPSLTSIQIPSGASKVTITGLTTARDISSCYVTYTDGINNNIIGSPAATFRYDPSFGFYNETPQNPIQISINNTTYGYAFPANSPWIGYTLTAITLPTITVSSMMAITATIYDVSSSLLTGLYLPSSNYAVNNFVFGAPTVTSNIVFLNGTSTPTIYFPSTYTLLNPVAGKTSVIIVKAIAGAATIAFPAFTRSVFTTAAGLVYNAAISSLSNTFGVGAQGLICQFTWLTPPSSPLVPAISSNGVTSPSPYSLNYVLTNLPVSETTSYASYTYTSSTGVSTNVLSTYGPQTNITISGLPPDTSVTNMVLYYLTSANGTSFTAVTQTSIKTVPIPPPQNVVSSNITINSIDILWNPSPMGNNIQYSYTIGQSGYNSQVTSPLRISTLNNDISYNISVYAYDPAYSANRYWSVPVTLSSVKTIPLTFSLFSIFPTPASNTSLTIQWTFAGSTRGYPDASGSLVWSKNGNAQTPIVAAALTTSPYTGSYVVTGLQASDDINASLFFTDGSTQNTTPSRSASSTLNAQFGFYDASNNASTKMALNTTLSAGYAFPSGSDFIGYTFNSLTLTQGLISSSNQCAIMANIYNIPNADLRLNSSPYESSVTLPLPASSSYIYFTGTSTPPTLYFQNPYTIRNPSLSPDTTVVLLQIVAGTSTVQLPTFTNGGGYDISKNATSVAYNGTTMSNAFTNFNGRSTICQFFNLNTSGISIPPVPVSSTITSRPYDISYNLTNLAAGLKNYVSYTSPSVSLLSYGSTNPVVLSNLIPNTVYNNLTSYYQGLQYTSPITIPGTSTQLSFYASSLLNNGNQATTRLASPIFLSKSATINSIDLSWNPVVYPGRTIWYDVVNGTGTTGHKLAATQYTIPNLTRNTLYNSINVYAYDISYTAIGNYSNALTVSQATGPLIITGPTIAYAPNSNTKVRVAWGVGAAVTSDPTNPIAGTVYYAQNGGAYIPQTLYVTNTPTSFYYDITGFNQRTDVSGYIGYKDITTTNNIVSNSVSFVADPSFGFFGATKTSTASLNTGSSVGYVVPTTSNYIGYTFNSVVFPLDISGTASQNVAIVANVYEILTTNLSGLYSGSRSVTVGTLASGSARATSYIYFLSSATPVKPTLIFPQPYTIGQTAGYSTVILFQVIAGTSNVTVPLAEISSSTQFWTSVTYTGTTMTNVSTGAICQFNYIQSLSPPPTPTVTTVTSPDAYSLQLSLGNQSTYTTYASLLLDNTISLYSITSQNSIIGGLIPSTSYGLTVYYAGTGTVYATSIRSPSTETTSQLPAPTITFGDISFNAITVIFAMPSVPPYSNRTYRYNLSVNGTPGPSVTPQNPVTSTYTIRYLKNNTQYTVNVQSYDTAYATQLSLIGSAPKTTLPLTVTTPVITPVANSNSQVLITWTPVLPTGYAGVLATGTLYYYRNGNEIQGSPFTITAGITTSPLITGLVANDVITSYVRYQGTGESINDVSSAVASLTFVSSFGFDDASANATSRLTMDSTKAYGYTFPVGSAWIGNTLDAITFPLGIYVSGGSVGFVAKIYIVPFISFISLYQPSYLVDNITLTPTFTSNIAFVNNGIQTPTLYFPQQPPAINEPTGANYTVILLQIVIGSGSIEFPTYKYTVPPNDVKNYNTKSTSLMYSGTTLTNLFLNESNNIGYGLVCTFNNVPQTPTPVPVPAPIVTTVSPAPYSVTFGLQNGSATYMNYVAYTDSVTSKNILSQSTLTNSSITVSSLLPSRQYNNITVYYAGVSNTLSYYDVSSSVVSPVTTTVLDVPQGYAITTAATTFNTLTVTWIPLSYAGVTILYDISVNGSTYNNAVATSPFIITGRIYDTSYNIAMYAYDSVGLYKSSTQTIAGRTASISVTLPTFARIPNINTAVLIAWTPVLPTSANPSAIGTLNYWFNGSAQASVSITQGNMTSYRIIGLTASTDISAQVIYTDGTLANRFTSAIATYPFDSSFGTNNLPTAAATLTITPTSSVGYSIPSASSYNGYKFNTITFPVNISSGTSLVAIVADIYDIPTTSIPTSINSSVLQNINTFKRTSSYVYFIPANTSASPTFYFSDAQTITSQQTGNTTVILFNILSGTGNVQLPAFTNTTGPTDQGSLLRSMRYDASLRALTDLFYSSTPLGAICQFKLNSSTPQPVPSNPSLGVYSTPDPYTLKFPIPVAPLTSVNSYTSLQNGTTTTLYSTGEVTINSSPTLALEVGNLLPNTKYNVTVFYIGDNKATSSTSYTGEVSTQSILSPSITGTTATFNSINVLWGAIQNYGKTINYNLSANGVTRYNGPGTTYNITSLTQGQNYNISLYAYDVNYNSAAYWSLPRTKSQPTAALTVSPPTIQYTANSNANATISWTTSLLAGDPNAIGTLTYSINGGTVVSASNPTSPYPINGLIGISDISCRLVYTDGVTNTVTNSAITTLNPLFGISGGTPAQTPLTSTTSSSVGFAIPANSTWIGNKFNSIVFTSSITATATVALVANVYTVLTSSLSGLYPTGSVNLASLGPSVSSYLFFLTAGTPATPTIFFPSTQTLSGSASTNVILLQIVAGSGTISFPTSVNGIDQSKVTSVSYTGTTLTNRTATSVLCQFNLSTQPPGIDPPNVTLNSANTNPYILQYSVNTTPTPQVNSYVELTNNGVNTLYSTGVVSQSISVPETLIPNTPYNATVYYGNGIASSALIFTSTQNTPVMPAPTALVKTASTITSISLSWTGLSYAGRSYIYNISGSGFSQIQVSGGTTRTISNLALNTQYNIVVYAYDTAYTASQYWSPASVSISPSTTTFKASIANTSNAYTSSIISWEPPLPTNYTGILNYTKFEAFKPPQINGCVLWLDAADRSTVVEERIIKNDPSKYVKDWYDKSGTGNHAFYQQFLTYPSVLNYSSTRSAVYFGGVGLQYGSFLNTTKISIPQNTHCLIAVILPDNANGCLVFNSPSLVFFPSFFTNPGPYYSNNGMSPPNTNLSTPSYSGSSISVITANVKSGTQDLYINGILNGTIASTLVSGSYQMQIGGGDYYGSNQFSYAGYIYEVVVYNRFLDSTEITTVTNYLMKKWTRNIPSPSETLAYTYPIPTGGSSLTLDTSGQTDISCTVVYTGDSIPYSTSVRAWNYIVPTFHQNNKRTGLSPFAATSVLATGQSPSVWSYTTGGTVGSSPAIGSDGTIYVGSNDNKLYAISPLGVLRWSYATTGTVGSSPTIGSDGTIYVGSNDTKLYAISPPTSETNDVLKWSYTTGGAVGSSPAIGSDGTIYVGSNDNKLYAISPPTSGKIVSEPKWSYTTGGAVSSSPAIGSDGTIYVGSNDNKLYAISPPTSGKIGEPKWSYTTGGAVSSSPAIGSDGTIYVGSNDNKLYAISPLGVLKWSYTTGGAVGSSPVIGSDGTIYVGSNDNKLYAISPPTSGTNGVLKWSYITGGAVGSSPVIGADGRIYVGSNDSKLYAFQNLRVAMPTFAPASSTSVTVSYTIPSTGTSILKYSLTGISQPDVTITGTLTNTISDLANPYPYITANIQYTDTNSNTVMSDTVYYGGGWPTAQYNNTRAGLSIFSRTVAPSSSPVWTNKTFSNGLCCASVLSRKGDLYFVTTNTSSTVSTLYSLNVLTGETKWSLPLGSLSISPLYELTLDASDNIYYINQDNSTIGIVNGVTGVAIGSISGLGTKIVGGLAIDHSSGAIYYGAINGSFYSYNRSGVQNWGRTPTPTNGIYSPPSIDAAGNVYIPTNSFGEIYSYDSLGTQLKKFAPTIIGGKAWSSNCYTNLSAAVIRNDVLYCSGAYATFDNAARYQIVFASTISTGAQLWQYSDLLNLQLGIKVFSTCVTDGSYVYFCSTHDNRIYALNASTGALVSFYQSPGVLNINFVSLTVDALSTVYFGSTNGSIYALKMTGTTLALQWSRALPTGDHPTGIVIGQNGTLYVGSNLGYMYAF